MKIRLHGTADECREVAERLAGIVEVLAVSEPYADRGASVFVRVYVEERIALPLSHHEETIMTNPTDTGSWSPGDLEDLVGLIAVRVGIWNDNGYPEPLPFEGAHPVPPLGQRSADNIKAAQGAVEAIDELTRDLHALRAQIVTEIRADQDARTARVDAVPTEAEHKAMSRAALRARLAEFRQDREAWEEAARACICPPGLCLRRDFRDHTGEIDPSGCMVCADLHPEQPCYGAVLHGLRAQPGR
jgi:hypothetical protein